MFNVHNFSFAGKAHREHGNVCQDFSLVHTGRIQNRIPYALLLVADGHGHPLYYRSSSGSQFACEVAHQLFCDQIYSNNLSLPLLIKWSRDLFPGQFKSKWTLQLEHHSLLQGDRSLDINLYGTTFGLTFIAPGLWFCLGIGDWTLVFVRDQDASLLSQEDKSFLNSNETLSLCLPNAEEHIVNRFSLGAWDKLSTTPFFMLFTDGLSNSCFDDVGLKHLCVFLSKSIHTPDRIVTQLLFISDNGSQDDISLAAASIC